MSVSSPPTASTAASGGSPTGSVRTSAAVRAAVLIIILAAVYAFAGVGANEFVDWDDKQSLVRNEAYKGLDLPHLRWMFTTGFAGHYQPLTWLSFAIDWRLYGVVPLGFHLTNLLLHVATSIGFFFVARRLIGSVLGPQAGSSLVLGALAAALLFAIHPLRVESVAWATERRDVLSAAWLMAATLFYLRAVQGGHGTRRRGVMMALAFLCYVASLGSKAAGITWPVVLLILDIYPLRRLASRGPKLPQSPCKVSVAHGGATLQPAAGLRRILLEKGLFAFPALIIAVVALWAQAHAGALRSLAEHPLPLRVGQAFYGLMFYLWKTVWPVGLVPLYEQRPGATALDAPNVVGACLVVAATGLFWQFRRRRPFWLAAWAVYVVLLSPVLGMAQSGPQVVADRYTYLPSMAWAVLIGGGICKLWDRAALSARLWRGCMIGGLGLVVGLLLVLTRAQTRVWENSYTLWNHVIDRAPDTGMAHSHLSVLLNTDGEYEAARKHALTALSILPGNHSAHVALARASLELANLAAADWYLDVAREGYAAAEEHLRIALEIRPDDSPRWVSLAIVYTYQQRDEEAVACYREAIKWEPDNAVWSYNLASLLASLERHNEAISLFRETVRKDPTYAAAYYRGGIVLSETGEFAEAIAMWDAGLAQVPGSSALRAKLAWVLATCPVESLSDGQRAVALASVAVTESQGPDNLRAREALAAALAQTGEFARAVATVEALLAEHGDQLPEASHRRLTDALASYRHHRPFVHEP